MENEWHCVCASGVSHKPPHRAAGGVRRPWAGDHRRRRGVPGADGEGDEDVVGEEVEPRAPPPPLLKPLPEARPDGPRRGPADGPRKGPNKEIWRRSIPVIW